MVSSPAPTLCFFLGRERIAANYYNSVLCVYFSVTRSKNSGWWKSFPGVDHTSRNGVRAYRRICKIQASRHSRSGESVAEKRRGAASGDQRLSPRSRRLAGQRRV